ncbi:MAG: Uma2 family endonuclease [Desulfobacteraceae bacterium]|nr:Uma2 family endonuclease [Desulfobacteraceae bacterium]
MNLTELYESDAGKLLFEDTDEKVLSEIMVPLPSEDDLPYDDGEPMETGRHQEQMILLIESLKAFWGDKKPYFAGGNMFLHFDLSGKRHFKGPDFFLVLDVNNRERKSWVVWQELFRFPDVIIELLSDSTRTTDKTEKKELYEQVFRTPEYYIYDPFSFEFAGFRRVKNRYKTIMPDKQNRIYSPATGLYLTIRNERLRWMTEERYILPTNAELYEREMQISQMERERAEAERQKAEEEKQRAEAERQKAEIEKQKAEAEKKRADDAERMLEEYRRRFGELQASA